MPETDMTAKKLKRIDEATAGLLFLYAETPMHPGTGTSLGVVDLPIQRERITDYPIIQASSVKGVLRSEAKAKGKPDPELAVVFGPETKDASAHAGALTVTDARILLFPVRSLRGVFTWVTCAGVLARLQRDLELVGQNSRLEWSVPVVPEGKALTAQGCGCSDNGRVVLEEYAFEESKNDEVDKVGAWLSHNAFPQDNEFHWWREKMNKDLVILPDDDFRDFVTTATEITARTRLEYETKTVASSALWYEEFLPSETVMYSVIIAQRPRKTDVNGLADAVSICNWINDLRLDRIQIGGNETVGKGFCKACLFTGNH